jgi:hypothetical protein
MPRFRFTVRRMMVVVAIVAVIFAVGGMVRRSMRLRERAEFHERMGREEAEATRAVEDLARGADDPQYAAEVRAVAAASARLGGWHTRMGAKYRKLARHPWLPVEPDPPEPE